MWDELLLKKYIKFDLEFMYEGVFKSFRTESITKYMLTTINTRWEATRKGYGGKIH
jgi:hypothetical protein